MSIEVTCQCGKRLKARDELAGKRVKCPKCSQPLQIPSAAPAEVDVFSGLFDEEGLTQQTGPICPSCKAGIDEGAVLCIHCGYNLETGQKIRTNRSNSSDPLPVAPIMPETDEASAEVRSILAKAADSDDDEEDLDDRERYGSGIHAWLFGFVLLVLLGALLGGVYYYNVIYLGSLETSEDK
jgi:hypothetical protein